jgi:ubiquitin-protein ligase
MSTGASSSSAARILRRLAAEIRQAGGERQGDTGVKLLPPADESHWLSRPWTAYLQGPPETPYEGCVYRVSVSLPENYPHQPPTLMFETRCWHPNIGVRGHVCVDILQREWSPAFSLTKILVAVRSLLNDPDTSSPLNAEAARMVAAARRSGDWRAYAAAVRENCAQGPLLGPEEATFEAGAAVLLTREE